MPQGQLFVISAPSGAGKTSLVKAALERIERLEVSVSHTTRAPRPSEISGHDYHFVSFDGFSELTQKNAMFEYAEVFGNFYGTSKKTVITQLQSGSDVILEIDWQGAKQVRETWPEAISIFIFPPTREELRERLVGRQQDDESTIKSRMAQADETIFQAPNYDYWVINDDFNIALDQLCFIITGLRQRRLSMQKTQPDLLEKLLGKT